MKGDIEAKLAACHVAATDLMRIKGEIRELEVLSQQIDEKALVAEIERLSTKCNHLTEQVSLNIKESKLLTLETHFDKEYSYYYHELD